MAPWPGGMHTSRSLRAAALVVLCPLGEAARVDPRYAADLTVYHLNPLSAGAVPVNMDTGDELGDLNFFLPEFFLPLACADPDSRARFDCDNPERTDPDLVVTRVKMSVDTRYARYALCNLCIGEDPVTHRPCKNGTYICDCWSREDPSSCDSSRVGTEPASGYYQCSSASREWDCWGANVGAKTGGKWYSTQAEGQCKSGASAGACSWIVRTTDTVRKQCVSALIMDAVESKGPECFGTCGPRNTTSSCWIHCFFDTLLGPGSSNTTVPISAGMPISDVVAAWAGAFLPVHQGGCARIGGSTAIIV